MVIYTDSNRFYDLPLDEETVKQFVEMILSRLKGRDASRYKLIFSRMVDGITGNVHIAHQIGVSGSPVRNNMKKFRPVFEGIYFRFLTE